MNLLSKYLLLLLGFLATPGPAPSEEDSELVLNPLSNTEYLVYLFYRPVEPMFMPKGPNENVLFKLPAEYLPSRYQPIAADIGDRFSMHNATEITVPIVALPDLSLAMQLGRYDHFSLFIPYHRRMAQQLIEIFMGAKSYEDFVSLAIYCRPRINPFMYVYAMSITILHRPDTRGVRLPLYPGLFPEKFFNAGIFSRLREEASVVHPENRVPIVIPPDYTASDLEPEHRIAYFREDLGINLHHWHWHLVYPFSGPREIVNKDRRGELFYYMHSQLLARYNFERLSNKMGRVKRLINWREPIPEGYFPKLNSLVASRVWPPRQGHTVLRDINREDQQIVFDIQDLERWRDRIYQAIHTGRVQNEHDQNVELSEQEGINILGNIVESSILSINRNLYGDLHNLGHVAIAYCHDPDNRHLEQFAVMGDTPTAMRDPLFYRWHAFTDDIFQEYKNTLPRYTSQQLGFEGIRMATVEVQVPGGHTNEFSTFWQQSDIDLSRGLDFAPGGPLFVRVTHLQHLPFIYRIQVQNSGHPRMGTVRIFLAPRFDERGIPLLFRDQKLLFIELDKFQIALHSGQNVIERKSSESSVTIPYERTFRNLDEGQPVGNTTLKQFNYCGCGWPQHMLIPKGAPEGLPAELFVMVSNYIDDRVEHSPSRDTCQDGHSYCGIRDQLFPDRRAMGYPFDRMPRSNGQSLLHFMTPNMRAINVTIRFSDHTEPPTYHQIV